MAHDFVQYAPKIQPIDSAFKLQDKLAEYCRLAKEMGAADAKIISSAEVILDPKVRVKCQYPRCRFYKSCANCSPQTAKVDETKELLKLYNYGIFMIFKCPGNRTVSDVQAPNAQNRRSISTVISTIESAAIYDGYYFAMGYGSGPCKNTFCAENKSCSVLEGNGCRSALFARASMESVGIDVSTMITRQGWDINPIGRSCPSTNVPEGRQVGLVLVA